MNKKFKFKLIQYYDASLKFFFYGAREGYNIKFFSNFHFEKMVEKSRFLTRYIFPKCFS